MNDSYLEGVPKCLKLPWKGSTSVKCLMLMFILLVESFQEGANI